MRCFRTPTMLLMFNFLAHYKLPLMKLFDFYVLGTKNLKSSLRECIQIENFIYMNR